MATEPDSLPDLPLMCLKSADPCSTIDAFSGKNVVIDFWTTKCTRCPDALDKLDALARRPEYAGVTFASICCDCCDGARNILEEPDDEPRWSALSHYYMDQESKEEAKRVLGFKAVPFYVFVNDRGEIVQKGSAKVVDFDAIPGAAVEPAAAEEETSYQAAVDKAETEEKRAFTLDEDF